MSCLMSSAADKWQDMEATVHDVHVEEQSRKHIESASPQIMKKMPVTASVKEEEVTVSPCISPSPEEDCFAQDVLVSRSHQDSDLDCFFSSYSQGKQVRARNL